MAYELLLLVRDPPLATITLNRPSKRNALSHALRLELANAIAEIDADDEISVAILTGAPPVFCAGFDLSEFEQDARAFADIVAAGTPPNGSSEYSPRMSFTAPEADFVVQDTPPNLAR